MGRAYDERHSLFGYFPASATELASAFLTTSHAHERQHLLLLLCNEPTHHLLRVFEMTISGHSTREKRLALALGIADRLRNHVLSTIHRVFDAAHSEEEPLFVLEFLRRWGELPPENELRTKVYSALARRASGVARALLSYCGDDGLSPGTRSVLWSFVDPAASTRMDSPRIIEALDRAEEIWRYDVPSTYHDARMQALFDLLRHADPEVRDRALRAICQHGSMSAFERLRLVPSTEMSVRYYARLFGLLHRLWREPLDLLALTPNGFEHFVHEWLRDQGYRFIMRHGAVHDDGIDLEATSSNGTRTVVQCKRWNPKSGRIRRGFASELMSAADMFRAKRALFVTTADITSDLRRNIAPMNHSHGVELIIVDGPELLRQMDFAWGRGSVVIGPWTRDDSAQLTFKEFKHLAPLQDLTGRRRYG